MNGNARSGMVRRLLAAALSLALIFTSVAAVYAHAGHNGLNHKHEHVSVQIDGAESEGDHNHSRAPVDADHGECLDLICHGGFACVSPDVYAFNGTPGATDPILSPYQVVQRLIATLDRPPKSSASA